MSQLLKGKVAVVTGASRNMGRTFSEMLAAEGASIVIHYRSSDKKVDVDTLVSTVQAAGGEAVVVQADLTNVQEIRRLFDEAAQRLGSVDIFINTAGMVIKKPVLEVTEEEYDQIFAINSKAAFFCMNEAAKRMNDNGRIINLGTTLLGATTGYYSIYAGSKAPLEDFTRALAKEVGSRGITVNTVAPGPIDTSFFHPAETPESVAWLKQQSISGELGKVEDVVPMVQFLVSPQARWVTAQTIFVNGGDTVVQSSFSSARPLLGL